MKIGDTVILKQIGIHGKPIEPFKDDYIGKEYKILDIKNIKNLNQVVAKKHNLNYNVYAIFHFQNGINGFFWCKAEDLEFKEV